MGNSNSNGFKMKGHILGRVGKSTGYGQNVVMPGLSPFSTMLSKASFNMALRKKKQHFLNKVLTSYQMTKF